MKYQFSNVHPEWLGIELFDWQRGGLRAPGRRRRPTLAGRPRLIFDPSWLVQPARVTVPNRRLVRTLRRLTDEVWPVRTRQGKFWRVAYYLAPAPAVELARRMIEERTAA